MQFPGLLGNEQLKQSLSAAGNSGHFSHFYLISGPRGSGKGRLARLLAAAMLCTAPDEKPCMRCPQCHKVLEGVHPDVIVVDDPEKKTIPVERVRQARADLFIRPNEGLRKLYCIPRAQDLGLSGQNALLKVLEDPPEYGVFLLLTDNPDRLLPTVRSRCVELRMQPLPAPALQEALSAAFPQVESGALQSAISRSGGYLGQAREILQGAGVFPETESFGRAFAARDPAALLEVLLPLEKWKRDPLLELLSQWRELLADAVACRAGLPGGSVLCRAVSSARTSRELTRAARTIEQAMDYLRGNVSPGNVCFALSWQLR